MSGELYSTVLWYKAEDVEPNERMTKLICVPERDVVTVGYREGYIYYTTVGRFGARQVLWANLPFPERRKI